MPESRPLDLIETYEKYGPELQRFAISLVGPSAAQDVVSDVFLGCIRHASWTKADDPRAYLYRSVLNETRKHYRSEFRRDLRERRSGQPLTFAEQPPSPELLQAVGSLSLRQRSAVYLTYWLDLDVAEVAELLGITDGSVRRHLARARALLRKRVDRDA